jgi:SAM-dependent methyltransferase
MNINEQYPHLIAPIAYRGELAIKNLPQGHGIEWGALYWPTPLPPVYKVTQCDFNDRAWHEKHYGDKMPGKQQSIGFVDVECVMPFTDLPFNFTDHDFFIANHVFEHYPKPVEFLCKIAEVLRPGGRVMLSVPDADKIFDKKRPSSTLADAIMSVEIPDEFIAYKRIEHRVLVDDKTTDIKAYAYALNFDDDPHLWVFRQTTFNEFLGDIVDHYQIPLTMIDCFYSTQFYEMIVILEKV